MPTLDVDRNPRWREEHTLEIPARFDWLLLRDAWPAPVPAIDHVEVFGTQLTPTARLVPSDHYGVLADIRFA